MRPHQRRVALPRGQPAGAMVLADSQLGNGHEAQQIVSRDLPLLPLWYPDVMVIARKGVENIQVDPSNDYSFLRNVTVQKK